jgi:hypothetical protein
MAVVAFLLIGGLVAVALGIALCLWQAIKRRQRMAELHAPLLDRCVQSLGSLLFVRVVSSLCHAPRVLP